GWRRWQARKSGSMFDPFATRASSGLRGSVRAAPPPEWRTAPARPALNPFSLIRTMTVGSGITPDLLTPRTRPGALAGFGKVPIYRRWGIAPRPENVLPPHSGTARER